MKMTTTMMMLMLMLMMGFFDRDGNDSYYKDEVDGECKVHSNDPNHPNNGDGDDDDATINLRMV